MTPVEFLLEKWNNSIPIIYGDNIVMFYDPILVRLLKLNSLFDDDNMYFEFVEQPIMFYLDYDNKLLHYNNTIQDKLFLYYDMNFNDIQNMFKKLLESKDIYLLPTIDFIYFNDNNTKYQKLLDCIK